MAGVELGWGEREKNSESRVIWLSQGSTTILDFLLRNVRSHWRVLKRKETWSDLHFKNLLWLLCGKDCGHRSRSSIGGHYNNPGTKEGGLDKGSSGDGAYDKKSLTQESLHALR